MPETFTYPVEFQFCRMCHAETPHEVRPCEGASVKICSLCLLYKLGHDVRYPLRKEKYAYARQLPHD